MDERNMTPGAWKYLWNFRAYVKPNEGGDIIIRIPFGTEDEAESALKNAMFFGDG